MMSRDAGGRFHFVVLMVLALLAGCSSTGEVSDNGATGADLLAAVTANEDRAVLNMLSQGVDPDPRADSSKTPLMLAAAEGNRRIVRLLLAAGADVNSEDNSRSEEHTSELQSRPHLVCRP